MPSVLSSVDLLLEDEIIGHANPLNGNGRTWSFGTEESNDAFTLHQSKSTFVKFLEAIGAHGPA